MFELLKLKKYIHKYKYHLLFGLIALVIIDLLQLVIPRVIKSAIDKLATSAISFQGLIIYFIIIMLLAVGIAIGRFFWRYLIIGSSRRIERELRTDFYDHLLTLDFHYFDTHKTGDLMAHAVNDINAVRMALGFGFIILIDIIIMGIATLANMLSIHPILTIYSLIPFPVIALVSTKFGRVIHRLFEKVQAAFAILTERVRESLSGIKVVKVFVQEDGEKKKFRDLSRDYIDKNVRLIRVWGMFWPMIMFLAALGQVIIIWFGGRLVIYGQISIGSFVAFIFYLQLLVWPMIGIGWAINLFQRGAASQRRLNRIFQAEPLIKSGPKQLTDVRGAIKFKNVTFTFPDKVYPALDDITIDIGSRQFIGITGRIGSGKTSFVNAILRLYEPEKGSILLDNKDIKNFSIKSLRKSIAYVPQDTFLFSDTIRNNITFGKKNASDKELIKVAQTAHIHDEIIKFPKGFNTHIGERGVTLSGGQKQRLALARALLLDRPILILDDAVSSVDAETERKILMAIKSELQNRTSLVISHRVFVLQDADKIMVFDKGKIVEQGAHEELIQKKGIYYQIYKIQQLEMKIKGIQ